MCAAIARAVLFLPNVGLYKCCLTTVACVLDHTTIVRELSFVRSWLSCKFLASASSKALFVFYMFMGGAHCLMSVVEPAVFLMRGESTRH